MQFHLSGRHLRFSTSGFFPFDRTTLPLSLFDGWSPKNIGIAVGISLLYCIQVDLRNGS